MDDSSSPQTSHLSILLAAARLLASEKERIENNPWLSTSPKDTVTIEYCHPTLVEKFFRVDELKDILRGIAKALCSYLSTQQRAIVKSSKIIYKFLWKNIRKLLSRRNCGDRILDATLYNLGEAEKFWPIFMQVKNN